MPCGSRTQTKGVDFTAKQFLIDKIRRQWRRRRTYVLHVVFQFLMCAQIFLTRNSTGDIWPAHAVDVYVHLVQLHDTPWRVARFVCLLQLCPFQFTTLAYSINGFEHLDCISLFISVYARRENDEFAKKTRDVHLNIFYP